MNKAVVEDIFKHVLSSSFNSNDPYGDMDKMYIPKHFVEEFIKEMAIRCAVITNKCSGVRNCSPGDEILKEFGLK